MEKLVILDFSDASVHFYDVEPEADIDESYISNLGYHTSDCQWMFGEDMNIQFHSEILK